MSDDGAFNDVKFGSHIEHAFHALALDEKRGWFSPTMWESAERMDIMKQDGNRCFEQCWMVGDHSNVGGSWEDQRLADLSLAWMMSRYASLGVKFDQNYIYDEFRKNQKFIMAEAAKDKLPREPRVRRWGEGLLTCNPAMTHDPLD